MVKNISYLCLNVKYTPLSAVILSLMTINEWLKDTSSQLSTAGVATARLDALVLLCDALGKDKAWVLAHGEEPIAEKVFKELKVNISRRANHEPLAYIRGRSEFYGRDFIVSADTLQPRPETETMIKLFKKLEINKGTVVDVGTGSGAIAITIKLEKPELDVSATEINKSALIIAKKNADIMKVQINFHEGDLLRPVIKLKIDALLCNLPYVPDSHTINEAAMQEPKIAIFGGEDGLDLYRQMFDQIKSLPRKPKFILTESLPFQHKELEALAVRQGYVLRQQEDFIQVFETN